MQHFYASLDPAVCAPYLEAYPFNIFDFASEKQRDEWIHYKDKWSIILEENEEECGKRIALTEEQADSFTDGDLSVSQPIEYGEGTAIFCPMDHVQAAILWYYLNNDDEEE